MIAITQLGDYPTRSFNAATTTTERAGIAAKTLIADAYHLNGFWHLVRSKHCWPCLSDTKTSGIRELLSFARPRCRSWIGSRG